jgi:hypothetical protein
MFATNESGIDANALLQADAAVIAGLIVLLTLLSFKEGKIPWEFSTSQELVTPADMPPEQRLEKEKEFSKKREKAVEQYLKALEGQCKVRNILSEVSIGVLIPSSVFHVDTCIGTFARETIQTERPMPSILISWQYHTGIRLWDWKSAIADLSFCYILFVISNTQGTRTVGAWMITVFDYCLDYCFWKYNCLIIA